MLCQSPRPSATTTGAPSPRLPVCPFPRLPVSPLAHPCVLSAAVYTESDWARTEYTLGHWVDANRGVSVARPSIATTSDIPHPHAATPHAARLVTRLLRGACMFTRADLMCLQSETADCCSPSPLPPHNFLLLFFRLLRCSVRTRATLSTPRTWCESANPEEGRVCLWLCGSVALCLRVAVSLCICVAVAVSLCLYVNVAVCLCVCVHVCMYLSLCFCVAKYPCQCICVYVCV